MEEENKIIKILRERNNAGQLFTVGELRNFVESASVRLPQSTEVAFVYSGPLFPDGKGEFITKSPKEGGMPRHFEILNKIVDDSHGKIGIIDKTEAGILLNHPEFKGALELAVPDKEERDAILYGSRAENGIRKPDSISDKISRRFAVENKDVKFLAMTHFSGADSVYAQSELPAFLMMKGESVQGISRDKLHNLTQAHSIEYVRHVVGARSFEQMGRLKIAIDEDNVLVGYDTTAFWPEKFKHLGKRNVPDLPNVREIDFADVHKKLHPEQLKDLHKGAEISKEKLKDGAHFPALEKLGKNSGAVGGVVIGGLAGAFTLAAGGSKAEAAEIVYSSAVPYGETQIELAKGHGKAAARSATIETASNVGAAGGAVGGMVTGAAIGSVIPVVGTVAGAAVGGVVGSIGGGLTAAGATEYVVDHWDKAKAWLTGNTLDSQTAYQKLPSRVTHDMPPEVAALVEVRGSKPLFERQFNELKEHGGLGEVASYIEQNHHQAEIGMPSVGSSVNRSSQSYKTPATSFSF